MSFFGPIPVTTAASTAAVAPASLRPGPTRVVPGSVRPNYG
jgi:hypothetical protein